MGKQEKEKRNLRIYVTRLEGMISTIERKQTDCMKHCPLRKHYNWDNMPEKRFLDIKYSYQMPALNWCGICRDFMHIPRAICPCSYWLDERKKDPIEKAYEFLEDYYKEATL